MTSQLPSGISTRGVIDLSSLASANQPADSGETANSGVATALTQSNVQQALIQRSAQLPVVLVVWSSTDLSSSDFVKTLTKLAGQDRGKWELTTLDVHTQPELGAAFGVQGVPMCLALVAGQMVPLFQGVLNEEAVKGYLTQLLQLAAQQGLGAGAGAGDDTATAPQPSIPPEFEQAMTALEQGDFAAAEQIYQQYLRQHPNDDFARIGLEQVELLRRSSELNPAVVLQTAIERPQDLQVALQAADVEFTRGQVEAAFTRLLQFVPVTSGADRDQVRNRLVTYFDLLGPDDPRVASARKQLTAALF